MESALRKKHSLNKNRFISLITQFRYFDLENTFQIGILFKIKYVVGFIFYQIETRKILRHI
jgi:hypothetical protein